jgi:hypothetical protein
MQSKNENQILIRHIYNLKKELYFIDFQEPYWPGKKIAYMLSQCMASDIPLVKFGVSGGVIIVVRAGQLRPPGPGSHHGRPRRGDAGRRRFAQPIKRGRG